MLPARRFLSVVPRYTAVRALASASQATDPIQKLFLEKIREYSKKMGSAPNGLVDSDEKLQKQLAAEINRVSNNFGIEDPNDIANLGLKFEETCPLDSINLRK